MSEPKQAKLSRILGENMSESAGVRRIDDDKFEGFAPSRSASGEMSLDNIMEDEEQPRKTYDQDALEGFAQHLKIYGVLSPIQLRWSETNKKWLVVFGHRRFRAAKLAGLKTIPCIFSEDNEDESKIRVKQLVENCQREDLSPMEMARAIKSLQELTDWTNRKLGEELGYSHVTIGRYLDLLKLPENLQEKVGQGDLAATTAVEILRIKDKEKQKAASDKISRSLGGITRAKARELVAEPDRDPVIPSAIKEKQILVQNANVTIHRNPSVSDFLIQKELLAAAAILDPEKSET